MLPLEDEDIFSNFRGNPPAGAVNIEEFEEDSGVRLPKDYINFLRRSDGGEGFIGPNAYVIFWRLSELEEMNKAYQVGEYAPSLFIFGSDGGGEAFAFDARTPEKPIVSVPFVGMELDLARHMGATFNEFLAHLARS